MADLLADLEAGANKLEELAGDAQEVAATVESLGASLGLWGAPAGEGAGHWAFVGDPTYQGRKRRDGESWTAPNGTRYRWAWLLASDSWDHKRKVGDFPAWVLLVKSGPVWFQAQRVKNVWEIGGAREGDLKAIAALDPLAGVTEAAGVPFDTLTAEQKRRYLANAVMIAAVQYLQDPVGFAGAFGQIVQKQRDLGWCIFGKEKGCRIEEELQNATTSGDGRPLSIMGGDYKGAAARVVLAARGATGIVQTIGPDQEGAEIPAWQSCLVETTPLADRRACLDKALTADPGIQQQLDTFPEPWRPFSDPVDSFQWIKGVNGSSYLKLGSGDQPWVIRGEVAITLGGAVVLGVGTLAYFLIRAYVKR